MKVVVSHDDGTVYEIIDSSDHDLSKRYAKAHFYALVREAVEGCVEDEAKQKPSVDDVENAVF